MILALIGVGLLLLFAALGVAGIFYVWWRERRWYAKPWEER